MPQPPEAFFMIPLAVVSVSIITFSFFCFVVINKKPVVHFIASLTVSDHGNSKNLSTLLLYSQFTVSSRLRKHEDDLLRISRAMRHGQLQRLIERSILKEDY